MAFALLARAAAPIGHQPADQSPVHRSDGSVRWWNPCHLQSAISRPIGLLIADQSPDTSAFYKIIRII
jgi:hypothetical protein